jgi:hypothetical protein
LLQLVYQYVEKQLMDPEMPDDEPSAYTGTFATDGSTAGRHSRQQQLQQQHAKLQEELMLRSAAADYPSFQTNSLGPLPSNLLSVLTWPGQHAVVAGAADGSVMLLQYGSNGGSNGGSSGGNSGDSRSNEVWVTRLAGAGGVLTLAWHPSIQEGLPRYVDQHTYVPIAKLRPLSLTVAGPCKLHVDGSTVRLTTE